MDWLADARHRRFGWARVRARVAAGAARLILRRGEERLAAARSHASTLRTAAAARATPLRAAVITPTDPQIVDHDRAPWVLGPLAAFATVVLAVGLIGVGRTTDPSAGWWALVVGGALLGLVGSAFCCLILVTEASTLWVPAGRVALPMVVAASCAVAVLGGRLLDTRLTYAYWSGTGDGPVVYRVVDPCAGSTDDGMCVRWIRIELTVPPNATLRLEPRGDGVRELASVAFIATAPDGTASQGEVGAKRAALRLGDDVSPARIVLEPLLLVHETGRPDRRVSLPLPIPATAPTVLAPAAAPPAPPAAPPSTAPGPVPRPAPPPAPAPAPAPVPTAVSVP